MARKGNQQKNGMDRHTPGNRKRGSDVGSAGPNTKGRGKKTEIKAFPGEELPNGNHIDDSYGESVSNASHYRHGNTGTQPSGLLLETQNQGIDVRQELEESVSSRSNLVGLGFEEQNDGRNVRHGKSGLGSLVNGVDVKNVMENVRLSYNVLVRNLKAHVESMSKAAIAFVVRRKPLYVTLTTKLHNAHGYARKKIRQVYPIVWNFLVHFLNIVLLLSMIWLDCTLRGIDSFLRMGTTSFFSVVWCSILSMIAMVGMFKFLMVLGVAALLAIFTGFTIAIISVAFFGIVFLWFYGSFWTTMLIIFLGGLVFKLRHERLALLITSAYAIYSAWNYIGWIGLVLALNLSFISSDALIYFLKNNMNHQRGSNGGTGSNTESAHPSSSDCGNARGFSADCTGGVPSTSGADSETTSEDEVVRLLNCKDHYSALGFTRYENVDVSILKREYRKKAMLVHPDKNMGNEKAAEAFKKLQNAYEVLLDSLKRKTYDDELRREELLDCFRRFQSASQKNGRQGFFASGHMRPEGDGEYAIGDSRRIACKKCGNFHVWIQIKKSKSQARWCQECKDYHQAKDGDGWVEQFSQPLLFGLFQKVDLPAAYVCANSKIYDATEWYICQGMRCPANTHKPSFHVNTNVTSKHNATGNKGASSGQRGSRVPPTTNFEENMTEEEFLEWLQNAVQSGWFDDMGGATSTESPSAKAGNGSKSGGTSGGGSGSSKRKKKGKRQW